MAEARIQVLYGYAANGALRPQLRTPAASMQFGWRLIGGNNRELARGAQSYVAYTDVCEAVQLLRVELAELDWRVQNDAHTGKWRWHAEDAGIAVMTGGRSYERERDCRDCIQHVRAGMVDAMITPGVTVLRANGAAGVWRSVTYRNQIAPGAR